MSVVLPDWADTLLDVVGVAWPNVDEDAYRDMASALREFADHVGEDAHAANLHMQRLLSSGQGWAMEALSEHWGTVKDRHLKDLASAARTIAGALDSAATAIAGMKAAALVQLGWLADEAGIALSLIPVTGGLSALIGAGAIKVTQEALKRLIKGAMKEAVGYIVSAMAEPAVAALEGMAAELVVQVGATALGMQNGVHAGGIKQAGKEGFHQGVEGAKGALKLASAGDGPAAGGQGDVQIDHAEHKLASGQLTTVAGSVHGRTSAKLRLAKRHHRRTRGKDEIARMVDAVADRAMGALEKATKGVGDHLGKGLPKAVDNISRLHKGTDHDIKAELDKFGKRNGGRGGNRHKGGGNGTGHRKPEPLRQAKEEPRRNAVSLEKKTCATDPVDVATGDMVLPQTDITLPGVLPLVLRRTHLSRYRHGQWFGRSWASTLDERLEVDRVDGGAVWAREDGSLLIYPELPRHPEETILPMEGPRLPLSYGGTDGAETTYRISDPHTGLTRSFTGNPYRASPAHWLTEIEDRNGNRITFARRGDGAPSTVTHTGGYVLLLTTEADRVHDLSLRTPDGPVTVLRYGYDEEGNLDAVTNSSGLPLRFTYDEDARITSWTDRNDSTYRYVYDTTGRIARTTGPEGYLSSTFTYDVHPQTGQRITRYTDSTCATTIFQMNDALQVVAETDPLGNTTRYAFDSQDALLSHTDALGHTTRFERDAHGDLVAMVAADGVRTTAVYNDLRLPVEITERGGAAHRFTYDERGNRTSATDPAGATTRFIHDERGRLVRVVNAVGAETVIRTDGAGLPVEIIAPDGARAVFTRDAFGRVVTATDALGGTLRQGWTVEGLPAWRELPDGTREQWTWDPEGNLATHIDRIGQISTHTATHFDLRSSTRTRDGADHRFTHDTELRLTKVTNAQGLEWHYTYDAAGRLVAETDFDGRTLTYEHDPLGRVTRRTNAAGQSLTYERDVLGRVVRLIHDDGSTTIFEHDETGHVARISNPHADIIFERDPAGRIVSETVNGRTLTHAYDPLGRRIHRRTPSGATSTLEYSHEGLARYQAGDHTFHFTRDALGRETKRCLGTLTLHQAWDPVGRITHQAMQTPGASILERTVTYQADGTPVAIDDSRSGRHTYTLDPVGRITAVQADGWNERYTYNTAGDITHAELPARAAGRHTSGERHYIGSRITRAGRTTYTYDAQGRTVQRQTRTLSGKLLTWHFTWNAEDRLTRVTTPTGETWDYVYDGLGRRIGKHHTQADGHTGASIHYTWDGGQIAEQHDGATTLSWDRLGLQPLAQREARADGKDATDRRFFAIVADLTGSPSALLSPDGDTAWRARPTAWGATQWNRDATAYTPLRQPGQYFDPETRLHYNVNRYYDPDLGRYLTPDPLGLAPAVNHYAYVPNPFTLYDPLGLAGCEADPTWGGRVTFTRDQHGRPYEMNATITRDMLDEGTKAREALRPPGFLGGYYQQGRGHMLARVLGGSGDTLDNLFTITQNPTNHPEMWRWEKAIYDSVKKHGVATYNVYLEYTDDEKDSVPKQIQLEAYDHKNKVIVDTILSNPAHQQQQRHRRGLRP
ncbi:hypothetical protein GCM10010218_22800 [Streptomyces mashuensis]|uniref:Type IV secretion protein Rhs n=1 Tax=Streptomyces mashuensis TaxID=33904 RepID=A0A919B1I7_9ACTN|nr:DUF6531 domain-containing protein [Streptomyces mashuensis]GHF40825.1 hypothetical protein GCM10010218_22800 [Streptomyces mashuensis]